MAKPTLESQFCLFQMRDGKQVPSFSEPCFPLCKLGVYSASADGKNGVMYITWGKAGLQWRVVCHLGCPGCRSPGGDA